MTQGVMSYGERALTGDGKLGVADGARLVGNWSHLALGFQLVALIWARLAGA